MEGAFLLFYLYKNFILLFAQDYTLESIVFQGDTVYNDYHEKEETIIA
jgi:hypothetical protein